MSTIQTYSYTESELNEVLTASMYSTIDRLKKEGVLKDEFDADNYKDTHALVLAHSEHYLKRWVKKFYPNLGEKKAVATIIELES